MKGISTCQISAKQSSWTSEAPLLLPWKPLAKPPLTAPGLDWRLFPVPLLPPLVNELFPLAKCCHRWSDCCCQRAVAAEIQKNQRPVTSSGRQPAPERHSDCSPLLRRLLQLPRRWCLRGYYWWWQTWTYWRHLQWRGRRHQHGQVTRTAW